MHNRPSSRPTIMSRIMIALAVGRAHFYYVFACTSRGCDSVGYPGRTRALRLAGRFQQRGSSPD